MEGLTKLEDEEVVDHLGFTWVIERWVDDSGKVYIETTYRKVG